MHKVIWKSKEEFQNVKYRHNLFISYAQICTFRYRHLTTLARMAAQIKRRIKDQMAAHNPLSGVHIKKNYTLDTP